MNHKATLPILSCVWILIGGLPSESVAQTGNESPDPVSAELIVAANLGSAPVVAYSPDGMTVLIGSGHSARLWDVTTGAELRRFDGHSGRVLSVAYAPDGRTVLTGSRDGTARLWDIRTGNELHRLEGHSDFVRSVAFSYDGRTVLTGSVDATARLWDASSGAELRRFVGHRDGIRAVAFSPNGRLVATGSADATARLWSASTGEEVLTFGGHSSAIQSLTFSPDGRTVVSGSLRDGSRIWDSSSGEELAWLIEDSEWFAVSAVAFSPGGGTVVTGAGRHGALFWNATTGNRVGEIRAAGHPVGSLAFSPDGSQLLTGGDLEEFVVLWDVATRDPLQVFQGRTHRVSSVALSPDGRFMLSGGALWEPRLWTVAGATATKALVGHSDWILSVTFSPDSSRALTGSADGTARVWGIPSGDQLLSLEGHTDWVASVAFSPDGRKIVTGSHDETARIWDATTGELLVTLLGHASHVSSAVFSPDGGYVLSGGRDGARLWDAATGEMLQYLNVRAEVVHEVGFSPDGETVFTASQSGAKLWDIVSGAELAHIEQEYGLIRSVVYSPDGQTLLTGGDDGTARIWDAATRVELLTLDGHTDSIKSVAFSADGRFALTLSADYSVRLWDAETGRELVRIFDFADAWAAVDPNGRFDASNSGDVLGLHWVVGMEPIALNQLKDRYYEPGLLARILGFNDEPLRDVAALSNVALYPEVDIFAPDDESGELQIGLTNRGGGIGRVIVSINGKEIASDARSPSFDENADEASLRIGIAGHPYLVPGEENTIEVSVYNAEGYLVSRGLQATWIAPGVTADAPELWAVVAGVSDYSGTALDLNFAARDAAVFADALERGAERLFGAENVHLTVLSSDEGHQEPTRENIVAALNELSAAQPSDVVLVYLAGHGVAAGGQDGDYYFLTQEATGTNMNDPAVRSTVAISTNELTQLLLDVPVANKQVLILDTCGAGRVVEQLTASRGVPSSQIRALDRMQDRTGLFILAGSAADAVSYEASEYGQGLLTYSLLEGMRGASLRDDEFLDVSQWFGYAADRVQVIAADIGGVQRPLVGMPRGTGSFDVARLTDEERSQIELLEPRPFVIRAVFQLEGPPIDPIDLSRYVNEELRDVAVDDDDPPWVYVDTMQFEDGYQLSGRYSLDTTTNAVTVTLYLIRENQVVGTEVISGSANDVDALVDDIAAVATDML